MSHLRQLALMLASGQVTADIKPSSEHPDEPAIELVLKEPDNQFNIHKRLLIPAAMIDEPAELLSFVDNAIELFVGLATGEIDAGDLL